ncbi:MAG: PD-(D/E)XK nuclease family protein [Bdellovibrionota bacterium]
MPTADKLCGLRPSAWVSVGHGFSREDVKSLVLSKGFGITARAVTTIDDLAVIIASCRGDKVLGSTARQEVLKLLFGERRISGKLVELKRLKRGSRFFGKLDKAIQAGRGAAAHPEEERVLCERLERVLGKNPIRDEVRLLSSAYEEWMKASDFFDPPMLLRRAIDVLNDGWPAGVSCPEEICVLSAKVDESLEAAFWESIGSHTSVRRVGPQESLTAHGKDFRSVNWEIWHTFDDAADRLGDRLDDEIYDGMAGWNKYIILVPPVPRIRASLVRALEARKIPVIEQKKPGDLQSNEQVKAGLLPLEVVASDFEREKVVSWLGKVLSGAEFYHSAALIRERGIVRGLDKYRDAGLTAAYLELKSLYDCFSGRMTCEEAALAHMSVLKQPEAAVLNFFEHLWGEYASDMKVVGKQGTMARVFKWLEGLKQRIAESGQIAERHRSADGVNIHRLDQVPFDVSAELVGKNIFIFGLPSNWLRGDGTGDLWFSAREREVLATEFAVRSCIQVRQERVAILKSWLSTAREVTFVDAHYDFDGSEREYSLPLLRTLVDGVPTDAEPVEMGAYTKRLASYQALRPVPSRLVRLPAINGDEQGRVEISATALDRSSRCGFQSLVFCRWKLSDLTEPDFELWPYVRGNILHEAVRIILESGISRITAKQALEEAWDKSAPKGLLRSKRVLYYAKARLLEVLDIFLEKEAEFSARSGTRTLSLENIKLRLDCGGFEITGRPDRIDQHEEGIFVADYKSSSSSVASGAEMIETGYKLQLPFYAVAARGFFNQPVVGAQFIELTSKGGRSNGIFFKRFNGKEPGSLSNLRINSKSLIDADPEEVWSSLREKVSAQAKLYVNGVYDVDPKKATECRFCTARDLCEIDRPI